MKFSLNCPRYNHRAQIINKYHCSFIYIVIKYCVVLFPFFARVNFLRIRVTFWGRDLLPSVNYGDFMYLCTMDSTRQQKVGRQIQKDLGEIIQRNPALTAGALVTITRVNVTPDLSIARVNLSIFGGAGKDAVLNLMKEHKGELRYELGQRIRNQVRIIPELQFFIDDTLDRLERIDELLKH